MGNMYGLQSEVALSEIYTSRMDQVIFENDQFIL